MFVPDSVSNCFIVSFYYTYIYCFVVVVVVKPQKKNVRLLLKTAIFRFPYFGNTS